MSIKQCDSKGQLWSVSPQTVFSRPFINIKPSKFHFLSGDSRVFEQSKWHSGGELYRYELKRDCPAPGPDEYHPPRPGVIRVSDNPAVTPAYPLQETVNLFQQPTRQDVEDAGKSIGGAVHPDPDALQSITPPGQAQYV